MGTNYYGRKIPTQDQLQTISEAVLDGNIFTAKEMINEHEPIHIGKSSGGWQFLFNYNGANYYKNKQELIDWLKSVEIYDEYGWTLTFEDFWNIVSDRTWNGQPSKLHHLNSNDSSRYIIVDGLEFIDCEFS